MSHKIKLNFLWHMHQPYYSDDLSGKIVMPWVFLHAIKDYYDMPWYIEKFPNIKATFNLVPSLLVQLKLYENQNVNDKFLTTLKKPIKSLEDKEREYLNQYLFFSNEHNMIKPFPRYYELFLKKENFLDSELLDLEVLFILSWCGNYLRENSKIVKSLINKERNYTHEEKIELLNSLHKFIKKIIPYYIKLEQKGIIEVSTTPFNHPISPLLFDINNAKLANPSTTLPKYKGNFKDDALLQIDNAIQYYKNIFKKDPDGFWPAEGSICYDFLDVISKKGIKWACSDQDILYKSGHFQKEDIYKRNRLHFNKDQIELFFRDRELSDLIGFSYSGWDEESAVDDFLERLNEINRLNNHTKSVNVILDGENAWEYYKNNAKDFFELLYKRISDCDWIETTLFNQIKNIKTIPCNELHDIQPGSWINGNFNIWIGDEEKNLAWQMLFETKQDFIKNRDKLDKETIKKIKNEFLIAQSSDWFWWYGDDHHTDLASTFDLLFRTHLINIYTLLDKKVPKHILKPIIKNNHNDNNFIVPSKNRISATLDGKITNFYEWLGAGKVLLKSELSSMNMNDFMVEEIYFGCDKDNCFVALLGDIDADEIEIEFSSQKKVKLPLTDKIVTYDNISTIFVDIIELKFDKKNLEDKAISFKLFKNKKLVQSLPLYSKIEFNCIKNNIQSWYI